MRLLPYSFILPALLASASVLSAAQTDYGSLGVAAPWLSIPSSARGSALGEAGTVLDGDLGAVGANPAVLAGAKGTQVSMMHNNWVQNVGVEHGAVSTEAGWLGQVVAGMDYLSLGTVATYSLDASGIPSASDELRPSATNIFGGLAHRFGGLVSAGATVKYVMQDFKAFNSAAVAGDLGLLFQRDKSPLVIGISLVDLGEQLDGADLPLAVRAGLGYTLSLGEVSAGAKAKKALGHPADEVLMLVEAYVPQADASAATLSLGVEYRVNAQFAFRGGYKSANRATLTGFTGLTAGVGLRWAWAELNYAAVPMGELGLSNQVSLLARF